MLLDVSYCYTGGKTFDPTLPCVVFIHGAQNDHSVIRMDAISAVRVPGRLAEHQIEARDLYEPSVC